MEKWVLSIDLGKLIINRTRHNLLLNGMVDLKYTEAIAYQYSYMIAKKNNMNVFANGIIDFVKSKDWYWEYLSIPNEYSFPYFISF